MVNGIRHRALRLSTVRAVRSVSEVDGLGAVSCPAGCFRSGRYPNAVTSGDPGCVGTGEEGKGRPSGSASSEVSHQCGHRSAVTSALCSRASPFEPCPPAVAMASISEDVDVSVSGCCRCLVDALNPKGAEIHESHEIEQKRSETPRYSPGICHGLCCGICHHRKCR